MVAPIGACLPSFWCGYRIRVWGTDGGFFFFDQLFLLENNINEFLVHLHCLFVSLPFLIDLLLLPYIFGDIFRGYSLQASWFDFPLTRLRGKSKKRKECHA